MSLEKQLVNGKLDGEYRLFYSYDGGGMISPHLSNTDPGSLTYYAFGLDFGRKTIWSHGQEFGYTAYMAKDVESINFSNIKTSTGNADNNFVFEIRNNSYYINANRHQLKAGNTPDPNSGFTYTALGTVDGVNTVKIVSTNFGNLETEAHTYSDSHVVYQTSYVLPTQRYVDTKDSEIKNIITDNELVTATALCDLQNQLDSCNAKMNTTSSGTGNNNLELKVFGTTYYVNANRHQIKAMYTGTNGVITYAQKIDTSAHKVIVASTYFLNLETEANTYSDSHIVSTVSYELPTYAYIRDAYNSLYNSLRSKVNSINETTIYKTNTTYDNTDYNNFVISCKTGSYIISANKHQIYAKNGSSISSQPVTSDTVDIYSTYFDNPDTERTTYKDSHDIWSGKYTLPTKVYVDKQDNTIKQIITDNELVTATALCDLQNQIDNLSSSLSSGVTNNSATIGTNQTNLATVFGVNISAANPLAGGSNGGAGTKGVVSIDTNPIDIGDKVIQLKIESGILSLALGTKPKLTVAIVTPSSDTVDVGTTLSEFSITTNAFTTVNALTVSWSIKEGSTTKASSSVNMNKSTTVKPSFTAIKYTQYASVTITASGTGCTDSKTITWKYPIFYGSSTSTGEKQTKWTAGGTSIGTVSGGRYIFVYYSTITSSNYSNYYLYYVNAQAPQTSPMCKGIVTFTINGNNYNYACFDLNAVSGDCTNVEIKSI